MLSTAAFNAFLKTLEEPPEHSKFLFATTEIRKVPVTVLSRCQRFDLRRVEADVMMAHLANIAKREDVEVEPEALGVIARAAEGSVRDSLSLFDQAIAHAAGPVKADHVRQMLGLADRARVVDLFDALLRGDIAAALAELRDQYESGADPAVILTDLAEFTHFVTRVKKWCARSEMAGRLPAPARRAMAGAPGRGRPGRPRHGSTRRGARPARQYRRPQARLPVCRTQRRNRRPCRSAVSRSLSRSP